MKRKIESGKILAYIILLFSIPMALHAQKEVNNWYFGNNAGISFSGGAPVALADGALVTMEGAASISDASGNLLFYTDGMTIYDKTHNNMPNGTGLYGGASTSQSAVIVRRPGNANQYYVFTAAPDLNPEGICYTTVNMSLNGGKGDVTGTKNIQLLASATEKLTAVLHCNRRDVWVIAHDGNSNRFYSWLVTSTGVSASPVISAVGSAHNGDPIGCMKVSPDGQHLALGYYVSGGDQFIELFDFDNTSGKVSDPIRFDYGSNCYGVEFSPNSRYLYYTASPGSNTASINIYQVDLCAGTNAQIKASSQVIGNSSNGYIRTLQLGPDGKIYFSRFAMNYIGVIDSPNTPGVGCGFNVNGIQLSSGTICRAGLANFNQSYLRQQIDFSYALNCYQASFSSQQVLDYESCTDPISQMKWNFGDPASGAANTSTQQNPSHTYSAPGNYQVSLIVYYNCGSDTLVKTVNVNCGPQVTVNSPTICAGACANILASVTGGQPPYTYSWSPGLGSGAGPHNVCPASSISYTITVTDAAGKQHSATSNITVSSVPSPTLSTTNPGCNGSNTGTITASVSGSGGPFTFSWNSTPVQTGATLSGVPAGSYSVTVKNASNCTTTANAQLNEPALLQLSINNKTNVSCKGGNNGSAILSASGGTAPYTFSWSSGQSSNTVTNLSAGSHTATVTDANGCSASIQVPISEPTAITISNTLNAAACGQPSGSIQASANGGTAPYSYSWNSTPVQNNALASGLAAGSYTVTVTDAKGCTQTKAENLSGTSVPVLTLSAQQVSCQGGNDGAANAGGSAGTAPYTYLWSNGATGANVNGLAAGTYTVTLTDAAACSATQSVTITQPAAIVLVTSSTAATCGASNGTATVSISGGTAPYSSSWSSGAAGLNAPGLAAGSYTVTVTDAKGCSLSQSVGVSNSSGPSLNLVSTTNVSCFGGNDGAAQVNAGGGLSPYTFSWSSGQSSNTVTNLSAGSHTATVTDANGCSASIQVPISEPTAITISNTLNAAACGQPSGSIQASANGGTAPYSYSWNSTPVQNNALASGLAAGSYTVTVTDAKGCTQTKAENLSGTSVPVLTLSAQQVSCQGGNDGAANAGGSAGTAPYTYLWSNGATGANVNGLAAGTYTVTLTDAAACSATQSVTITQPAAIVLVTSSTAATCGASNGTATVSISGGTAPYSSSWSSGAAGLNAPGLAAGSYTVTVTDAKGCSLSQSVGVSNSSGPSLNLVSTTNVSCFGGNDGAATIAVSGGAAPVQLNWSNGFNGLNASMLIAGTYTITATDASGCTANMVVDISQPPVIQAMIQTTAATCSQANGTAQVQVSGGTAPYQITWSGSGANGTQVNQLLPGDYNILISDANNCLLNEPFTVTNTGGPIATIDLIQPISCPGGADGILEVKDISGAQTGQIVWSNGATTSRIENLNAADYSVTLTDLNGCSHTTNLQLAEPNNWQIFLSTQASTCGQANGSASLNLGGANPPYTVLWSNGQSGLSATGLLAGITTATLTDSKGCSTQTSATIADAGGLNLHLTDKQNNTCFGAGNGKASVSASGGQTPYQYQWSDGVSGNNRTNMPAGQYVAEVTDANGCKAQVQVEIIQPDMLTASMQLNNSSCGLSNGTATVQPQGGTLPYFFQWSNGSQQNQAIALPEGNISVLVSDANACQFSTSGQVAGGAGLSIQVNILQEISCNGAQDGSIGIHSLTSLASIQWSNGANDMINANIGAGTYQVIAIDNGGCKDTVSISLIEPPALTATLQVSPATCLDSNGTALVNASGGRAPYTFLWSNGTSSAQRNNLTSGNYQVQISDAAGCKLDQTVNVTSETTLRIAALSISDVSCYGLSDGKAAVTFSGANGSVSYRWSDGSTDASLINLSAGSFSITLTDQSGCTTSKTFAVNQPDQMHISVSTNDVKCKGESNGTALALVTGGTLPYNYSWDGFNGTDMRSNIMAGSYSLEVSDAMGCKQASSYRIDEPDALAIEAGITQARCGLSNGKIELAVSGGTAPYTFTWENGTMGQLRSAIPAGQYQIQVQDGQGCMAEAAYTILDPGPPVISVAQVQHVSCNGLGNGKIILAGNGGVGALQVRWNDNSGGAFERNMLQPGNYIAVLSDSLGCTDTSTVEILEPLPLMLELHAENVRCADGADGKIFTQISGGTTPYRYEWSDGTTQVAQRSQLTAGNWSVNVKDANECQITKAIQINQPDKLQLSIETKAANCFGSLDGFALAKTQGGIPPYQYKWSNGASTMQADSLGTGIYQVYVSDSNACGISGKAAISQPSQLSGGITGKPHICQGDSVLLIASGNGGIPPYTFSWSHGSHAEKIIHRPDSTHYYQASVFDAHGCNADMNKQVKVMDLPVIEMLSSKQAICAGECVTLEAKYFAQQTYLWRDGFGSTRTGASANYCYQNQASVSYSLQVQNEFQCTTNLQLNEEVLVHPLPIADFTPDKNYVPLLEAKIHFENNSQGATSYNWDFDSRNEGMDSNANNPFFQYGQPGQYPVVLTATNEFGCSATASRFIEILEDFAVYVPNTFTPNRDGKNEVFMPDGIGIVDANYQLSIFNKWGEKVFESNNRAIGWDGTSSGNYGLRDAAEGVFVWQLHLQDFRGNMHKRSGTVTLVR
ncbi:MAG: gliding motility-associated C-terminal domain-containing protein [Bacteroidia bacterium]|nr:gliding motility-associated C-terminal domain-containing protein [Bacteroidia bacterium]